VGALVLLHDWFFPIYARARPVLLFDTIREGNLDQFRLLLILPTSNYSSHSLGALASNDTFQTAKSEETVCFQVGLMVFRAHLLAYLSQCDIVLNMLVPQLQRSYFGG